MTTTQILTGIKDWTLEKVNVRSGYFECSTGASTAAKTVTATGYALAVGGAIKIKMDNANSAANPTLNINSTGAKALYYDGARASSSNTWEAGEVLDVYYDGTNFQANNAAGGGKFATGEKVRETSIEAVPTAGSTKLLQSGGALKVLEWIYKDRNLLSQIQRYIEISTNVAYVGGRTEGLIGTDGQISTPSAYKYTTLIPIKPATSYVGAGASSMYAALYDVNGVFVRRTGALSAFTTAVNEVYVRLCSNTSNWANVQLNEGSTVLAYESFYVRLKKNALDPEFLSNLNGEMYEVCSRLYEYSHGNYKSGYVSISGAEQAGTSSRRSGYLAYGGGDIIVFGRSTETIPLAVFFSAQSSDNCLGYFPNPRNEAYNNVLTIIKAADVPAGTTYVRFNGNTGNDFFNSLDKNPVTVDTLNSALSSEVSRSMAVETQINTDLAKLIEKSTNLANREGYVAPRTFDDNGEIVTTSTSRYACENYIDVKPSTTYTMYRIQEFVEYDENKVFVKRNKQYNGPNLTVTTQSNTRYIRFGGTQLYRSQAQINEGSVLLDYEPYYDWRIPDDGCNKVYEAVYGAGRYYHGPYDIRKSDFQKWYGGLQDDYTVFGTGGSPEYTPPTGGWASKYSDVISAYDALMAEDTAYITKNTLGTASGTDAEDQPYTIYEYVFKPKRYGGGGMNKRVVPKILIDACIHGFERNSAFGLYYFLKDIVENWDKNESLNALRHHVEIHVIPVADPYGFDNNIRKNANGINVNRNFDCNGWTVVPIPDADASGDEPFDQPEAAIIRDWILDNADNLLMYINCHVDGMYNASGYNNACHWMLSSDRNDQYFNRLYNVGTRHIEEQTAMWTEMYNTVNPTNFIGEINKEDTENTSKGTSKQWACTLQNFLSMTLEGFNGLRVDDTQIFSVLSANSQKANSENIGNAVIQICYEYANS